MAATSNYDTPHLQTALTGPLQLLEKKFLSHQDIIESWFRQQWLTTPAPVYGSVDLRNSGFKLAPVDMNLFPAGFNNIRLNPCFIDLAVTAIKNTLNKNYPNVKKILLIPENHTRNKFYWENIQALFQILTKADFEVKIGSLSPEFSTSQSIDLISGSLEIHPIKRIEDKLIVDNFTAELVLLNNDLSEGIPEILTHLQQPLIPPAELGWSHRLKSDHFHYYANVSDEFAKLLQIDPWFIAPLFRHCGEIDFKQREGEECLAHEVEELFSAIKAKYEEYQIHHDPYIVVKADAGTYGMAIMMVKSVDDVLALNRKQRVHMSKTKGGQPVNKVIIQEGVYTFETLGVNNSVAEPVVYLIGERVIGGFYRVHKERGIDENLNSPGMHFEPLAFAKGCHEPAQGSENGENRFYAYGVIARLSMLAAAQEMRDYKKIG